MPSPHIISHSANCSLFWDFQKVQKIPGLYTSLRKGDITLFRKFYSNEEFNTSTHFRFSNGAIYSTVLDHFVTPPVRKSSQYVVTPARILARDYASKVRRTKGCFAQLKIMATANRMHLTAARLQEAERRILETLRVNYEENKLTLPRNKLVVHKCK